MNRLRTHTLLAGMIALASFAAAQQPPAAHPNRDAGKDITGDDHPTLSPFTAMRKVDDDRIEVRIPNDDDWHVLLKVGGLPSTELVNRTRNICGPRWWKRVSEDLVEVLTVLTGKPPGRTVDLELRNKATDKLITLKGASMTKAWRNSIRDANYAVKVNTPRPARSSWSADAAAQDLASLQDILATRFSYWALPKLDHAKLFERARQSLVRSGAPRADFANEVDAILRAFGDGHTRTSAARKFMLPGFAPCLIEAVDGGFVAFAGDRSRFVDADHPFVHAIDGKPIAEWLKAAAQRVRQCGPQKMQRDALRELRNVAALRNDMGLQPSENVSYTLRDGEGNSVEQRLRIAPRRRPVYGTWPRPDASPTRLIDGIGYLRIAEMTSDAAALDRIDQAMSTFCKDAKRGLIIDVRSNGGGTRDILRRLFPWFMKKSAPAHVANVAAYRIPPEDADRPAPAEGYLDNRRLYPASWRGWSKPAKEAIRKAARRFKPEWPLPNGFSDWHWFVLEQKDNPKATTFGRPVVILIDDGCFSATDIFLGAFKGYPGVTILGATASGGGSGRSRRYTLPNSRISFRASSMASFRPNGKLYERRGIAPDLIVKRKPTDVLAGGSDTQLERALELLRK